MLVEKGTGGDVPLTARPAAKHNRQEVFVSPMHRGGEIEAARPRIAGLDAVGALEAEQQLVVIAILAPLEAEIARFKYAVIFGVVVDQMRGEDGHVARGRDLLLVRQTGSVAKNRLGHANPPSGVGHQAGEVLLGAGEVLGDSGRGIVGRLGHQRLGGIAHLDGCACFQPELGGRLARGIRGHGELGLRSDLAGAQIAEQHIEGHHLGERGRRTQGFGGLGMEDGARVHVDDDGSRNPRHGLRFPRPRLAQRRHNSRKNERERERKAPGAARIHPSVRPETAHRSPKGQSLPPFDDLLPGANLAPPAGRGAARRPDSPSPMARRRLKFVSCQSVKPGGPRVIVQCKNLG